MGGTLWITGVAGFTGPYLVRHVATHPTSPRIVGFDIIDRPPLPLDDYHRINLADPIDVARVAAADPPDWIIHLAAPPPSADAAVHWDACVASTLGLALGLRRAGCAHTRLVGIGSAAEYQPCGASPISEDSAVGPATVYGRVKLAQTMLTLALPTQLGLSACVGRTFNLVGPGLPTRLVLGRLCDEFARLNGPRDVITVRHLETSRDFVDVRDAVAAYWLLAQQGASGEAYNVCTGVPVALSCLVDLLCAVTGKRPVVQTTDPHRSSVDPDVCVGTFAKVKEATGWTPRIDLRTTIEDMLAHLAGDDSWTCRSVEPS